MDDQSLKKCQIRTIEKHSKFPLVPHQHKEPVQLQQDVRRGSTLPPDLKVCTFDWLIIRPFLSRYYNFPRLLTVDKERASGDGFFIPLW